MVLECSSISCDGKSLKGGTVPDVNGIVVVRAYTKLLEVLEKLW